MVFVFDIDGTLLEKGSELDSKTRDFLLRLSQDHTLVFASGRMYRSVKKLLERELGKIFPIIAYNGALIVDESGKILYEATLDSEIAENVIVFLRSKGFHRQAYVCDILFVEEDNEKAKDYAIHSNVEYVVVDDLAKLCRQKPPLKLLVIDENRDKLRTLAQELKKSFPVDAYGSFPTYLEIVPPDVSKGKALEILARIKGFSLEETVAFGDSDNDLGLLETAAIGIAVGNATEILKSRADYVTKGLFSEGVVEGVEAVLSGVVVPGKRFGASSIR